MALIPHCNKIIKLIDQEIAELSQKLIRQDKEIEILQNEKQKQI